MTFIQRRLVSRLALSFVVTSTLLAQTQPQPQTPPQNPPSEEQPQPTPVFRTGINLVRVDVTATDRQGNPVTDLEATDFEIIEDDIPQTIESFRLVQLSGAPASDQEDSLEIRSVEHAQTEAAKDDIRLFVIFFDEYHVARGRNSIVARDALTKFVKALGPTDLIALMDPLTPLSALRFTRDRQLLIDQIQKLDGRFGVYIPTRSVIEEQQLSVRGRSIEHIRSEVSLSALTAIVTHLGSLREGRKSVVLVSEGFPGEMMDINRALRTAYEAANRNNAAIHILEPNGLSLRTFAGLRSQLRLLADSTDGHAIINSNDPMPGLEQVIRDASAYYLMGYASSQAPADDKFHKIEVKVKRRGVEVRARKGYWAESVPTTTEEVGPEAERKAELGRALTSLPTGRDHSVVTSWVGFEPATSGNSRVTFVWEPLAAGSDANAPHHVVLRATTEDGDTYFEGAVPADGTQADKPAAVSGPNEISFEASPGPVKLRLIVKSSADEVVDDRVQQVTVPEWSDDGFTIATPRVFCARTPAEYRGLLGGEPATPTPRREFRRTERVLVRITLVGNGAARPVTSAQLVDRRGQTLLDLAVADAPAPASTYQIAVPISSMATGEYVVRIAAQGPDGETAELLPIRILP